MSNMTLSIPENLYKKMAKHSELKWSEIARKAFEKKIMEIELLEEALKRSELTENDAERIGHKIKAGIAKRIKSRFS
ncbi:MAG: hypothetical protein AABX59_02085 [Nanoarchaeota archaeon]